MLNLKSLLAFVVTSSVPPSGEIASANGSPSVGIVSICVPEATSMMPTLSLHWFDTYARVRLGLKITSDGTMPTGIVAVMVRAFNPTRASVPPEKP